MSHDLDRIGKALTYLPAKCRYHGSDFDFLGSEPWGEPRCDSCKPPAAAADAKGAAETLRLREEYLRSMHAVESGLRAEVTRLTGELDEARPIVEAAREYALAKHALTRFRPGRDDLTVLADRHTTAMNRLFLLALPPALVERVKFDDDAAVPPRDEETPA